MKTIALVIIMIVGCGIINSGFTQTTTGKVYFFQSPNAITGALGPGNSVFMDKKIICQLKAKRYSIQEIPAGEHTFSFQRNGRDLEEKCEQRSISLIIEPGKTYFIELFTFSQLFTDDYFCFEVPEDSFTKITRDYKQNLECK